jgi:hypothetical protein
MFKKFWLGLLICFSISACSPSAASLIVTEAAAQTQTQIAAPMATFTPSPTLTLTFTPTFTPTVTPTPTPLGGGSGVLVFGANPFPVRESRGNEKDGIYTINVDGSNLKQVLGRSQLEAMIGKKFRGVDYSSNAGKNYVSVPTIGFYSVTNDWELSNKLDLQSYGALVGFSVDGKYTFYIRTDTFLATSSIDGSVAQRLPVRMDEFVGWSADNSTIYFTKNQGANQRAINIDGSNNRELTLDAFNLYQPYEDISEGNYFKRIDAYAVSPDKAQVAFTWMDLIFVSDPDDLEFTNPRLLLQIPGSDTDTSVYTVVWSPDSRYLLVEVRHNYSGTTEVFLINVQQKSVEAIFADKKYSVCGFSPDGHQVILTYVDWAAKKYGISLSSLDGQSSTTLVEYNGYLTCPSWLSSSE